MALGGGMSKPTTLYRLYSDTFELLYVGISSNPWRRFEQHCADKPWWGDVAHVRTMHFADRDSAATAEVHAIRTEKPRHNVAHAVVDVGPQPGPSADQIRAVCSLCGDLITPRAGYLELDMWRAQRKLAAREKAESWTPGSAADGLEVWLPEPWHAYHSDCRFDAGAGPVHQIELRDLTSWFDLCRVTADLAGMWVFPVTNWTHILRSLGSGEPGLLRLVSVEGAS